jgi:hypothetical protein
LLFELKLGWVFEEGNAARAGTGVIDSLTVDRRCLAFGVKGRPPWKQSSESIQLGRMCQYKIFGWYGIFHIPIQNIQDIPAQQLWS